MAEEQSKTQQVFNVEKDWELEGDGQKGDPNLNVCESCQ